MKSEVLFKKHWLVLSLLSVFFFLHSCTKEHAPDPTTNAPAPGETWPLRIPDEMKAYVEFKPGTYWVYRDSISGQLDSVYVTTYDAGFDTSTGHIYYDWGVFEWLLVEYKSSRTGYFYYTYVNTIRSGWYPDNYPFRHALFIEKHKPGDFAGDGICFGFPIEIGHTFYTSNYPFPTDEFNVKKTYSTYYQDSIGYPYTVKTECSHFEPEGHGLVNFYYSKNNGIIRKEIADSNLVWKLVKYNIVQ